MVRFQPSAGSARDKHDLVAAAIREKILANLLPPGARLPRRTDLVKQFRVSSGTLQRAMNQLVADGFLEARQRGGTRVAPHPPHLTRFGVVLPSDPRQPAAWNRFWQAMLWATLAFPHTPQRVLVPLYVDAEGRPSAGQAEAEREVEGHQLAGLVFTNHPGKLASSPLITQPGLPRVAFMSDGALDITMPKVWADYASFFTQAVAWLAAQGRRRVVVVGDLELSPCQSLWPMLARAGLTCPPAWRVHGIPAAAPAARAAVAQAFTTRHADPPDALLVLDDNLLDDACGPVLAAGRRIPEDVAVVSHWNFPNPLPRLLPIHFIGFDARQLLATCVARLEATRRAEPVPSFTAVAAITADESAASSASLI